MLRSVGMVDIKCQTLVMQACSQEFVFWNPKEVEAFYSLDPIH